MSIGYSEIEKRFGFYAARLEDEVGGTANHADLRHEFRRFAQMLDAVLPDGREKALAFTALEEASMWSHKSVVNRVDAPSQQHGPTCRCIKHSARAVDPTDFLEPLYEDRFDKAVFMPPSTARADIRHETREEKVVDAEDDE
jgi:hypothetical protein